MLIKLREAQSTAEYAILISVIVGAALAMQVYVKRSLQAKMHDASAALTDVSADITGDGVVLGTLKQYEPYYNEQKISNINRETASNRTTTTLDAGALTRNNTRDIGLTSISQEQTHTGVIQQ